MKLLLLTLFMLSGGAAQAEKLNCVIASPRAYVRLLFDTETGIMSHNDLKDFNYIWEYRRISLVPTGGVHYQLRDGGGAVIGELALTWAGYDFYEMPRKTHYPYYIRLKSIVPGLTGGCASSVHHTTKSA